MADPKQTIMDAAKAMKRGRLTLFAGVARLLQDEAFEDSKFLDHTARVDLNIIKGDAVVLATTTAYANAKITIPRRSEGQRLVCNVGLLFDGGAADAKVPAEVLNQLHKNLTLKWSKRSAKEVAEAAMRYSLGFNLGSISDGGAVIAASDDAITQQALIAHEAPDLLRRLAPQGVENAIQNAIDLIDSDRDLVGELDGLNGVTVAASHSGVNVTPYALVIDAY